MKNMMFARTFPMTHPRKGEPTWFVEKIWKCLWETTSFQGVGQYEAAYQEAFPVGDAPEENIHFHLPKGHTIRAGNRWKVGDYFKPLVWSGKPYRSKTIQIANPLKAEKIWSFELFDGYDLTVDGQQVGAFCSDNHRVAELAVNDGLDPDDFVNWFSVPSNKEESSFIGQIICWNPTLHYDFLTPQQYKL